MRILICDDSLFDREYLTAKLKQYCEEIFLSCEVIRYETGEELIQAMEIKNAADFVFLGMYLEEETGTDVVRKLRNMDYAGEIIFVTEAKECGLGDMDGNAVVYLRKDGTAEELCACMDKLLKERLEKHYIILKRSGRIPVPYAEIVFVESSNSKCILHQADGTVYTVYKQLGEIELELQDRRFLRCHQSYLVNMDYVQRVERWFELVTGDIVSIRQREIKLIKQNYYSYLEQR